MDYNPASVAFHTHQGDSGSNGNCACPFRGGPGQICQVADMSSEAPVRYTSVTDVRPNRRDTDLAVVPGGKFRRAIDITL